MPSLINIDLGDLRMDKSPLSTTLPSDLAQACMTILTGAQGDIAKLWPGWSQAQVWRRMGAMVGFGTQGSLDLPGAVFTPDDLRGLAVKVLGIGCLSGIKSYADAEKPGGGAAEQNLEFYKVIAAYQP
ncbi:glycoside hydrolase family 18 protein [Streptomyces xanthochromogenes]|nr:hypothetical protein [Streptomyces xanthochromogenes]